MSFIEIQCGDVLASVIFIVEGEFQEIPQADAIQSHIVTCGACAAEIEHEKLMHQMLQDVLKRSCDEQAPEELHESIHRQLREQMAGTGSTEVVTQFSMTEISIEIDEFGNVEHREIQIEQTHIQHFIDDQD
jgi:transcriptional regulator NrdR family protein